MADKPDAVVNFTKDTLLSVAIAKVAGGKNTAGNIEVRLIDCRHGGITVEEARSQAREIRKIFLQSPTTLVHVDFVLDFQQEDCGPTQKQQIAELCFPCENQQRYGQSTLLLRILEMEFKFSTVDVYTYCDKHAEFSVSELRQDKYETQELLNKTKGKLKVAIVDILTDGRINLDIETRDRGKIMGILVDDAVLAELIFLMAYIEEFGHQGEVMRKELFGEMLEAQRKLLKCKAEQTRFLFLQRPKATTS